jgi:mono/diheme cytochrome c family protein
VRALCLLALVAAAWPAAAQDARRGQQLYETHCLSCHYERIHKRDRTRSVVRSLVALRVEVASRAEAAKLPLRPEDLDDIAEYLNRSYYKFER